MAKKAEAYFQSILEAIKKIQKFSIPDDDEYIDDLKVIDIQLWDMLEELEDNE